ncbi:MULTISPECIES: ribosome biogenesis GTPase Der [Tissierellales]|jgi:GTP-binding protein|uniref:GTPase Der n=1 Tax=Acidilutibacter cellobiosedens TaxID=2507161 RepID=A0A410QBT9_9FIRM|nr:MULTISPECIES: ribosome biogenesis GTPase Der [Tissierellales]MBE6082970.1 ribosome biogenesis GTPase Der [Tissierellaceae bacterium]QAT61522.1 ribosome biogenesis GTPase Der [Acidilutibacter cellobiosedens]SCL83592.1 GTP-binding protein EngA [Sporanaerobacter sp. PP17-6a]
MDRPVVSIVGRPNVGKSTLFNRIVGRRVAITENNPGVTRDRIYEEAEWLNKYFTVIDTGGLEPFSEDKILSQIRRQAEIAIEMSDVILFVVDGLSGVTATDRDISNILRKSKKEVILVCNKIDTPKTPDDIYEFYELGIGEIIPVSAAQGLGIGDLLDEVVKYFPQNKNTEENENIIKVAVIGKPNAGKSSLINNILGEERVIVTDIPGTTRDAIDTYFTYGDNEFILIDTAGLRRKRSISEEVERYSVVRTLSAIERADICILVIDGEDGITEQDAKIAGYAYEKGKACVIAVNKWDIVEKEDRTYLEYERDIKNTLPFMMFSPIIFISAKTGKRVNKLFEIIKSVYSSYTKRVTTGVLNDIVNEAVILNQPPTDKGRRLKVFYATQIGIKPPKFLIFINDKKLMHFSYARYLENQIRNNFGFEGTPLQVEFREREGQN